MAGRNSTSRERMNPDMKRLKLLAAVAVLGVFACEEATPPPPVGSIVGQVAIEGTGIDGVSVNLSNGNSTTTSGGGSYRFDNVEGGAYTVTISGYPSDATFDATSAAATISSAGQSVTINFTGEYIRTASVMGSVTVENQGLRGVTVSLSGRSSATAVTDDNGRYTFTGLRMGDYSVTISGFDSDEVGFSSTASAVSVGVGESKIVSFDGTYLRTAGIQGQVSVEGEGGLAGVNVSLTGGPDNVSETATTDASGQYSFARLRAGDYSVGISGYNTDDYEFAVTSQNVTVVLHETANVPFTGVQLRTSGISGRVSVEGEGLEGVAVTLSGGGMDADKSTATDAGGTYAFSGLAAGDYTVSIAVEGDAYVFESMSKDRTVGDDATEIVNFDGAHATTASISGMLFVDEAAKNDSYDEGEDAFEAAGVPVVLVGPGINDRVPSATDEKGEFMFANLKAGAYQLVVTITPEVQALLGPYAYGGEATGYEFDLGVGEAATQNIPFDITHQTVSFSVSLKSGDAMGPALSGATVNLYADLGGKDMVGTGETGDDGMTSIEVERADAEGNTVYAGITAEGYHVADEMQAVMWDPKSPATAAANEMDIVNLTADVSFSGMTIETDVGGGAALAGWAIDVMMTDEDGEMVAVADTTVEVPAKLGAAGEADAGMASFTRTVGADGLGTTYYFSVAPDSVQTLDGGQEFTATPMASDAAEADGTMLKYVHDGLSLAGTVDMGTIEVQYTTQKLVVSVHQEKDQVPGYTRTISGGDSRPKARVDATTKVDAGISLELRYIDSNGRSRPVPDYENRIKHPGSSGSVTFDKVPADLDIVVKASTDMDRMIINNDEAQAYRDFEANKVWYFVTSSAGVTSRGGLGAFGDQGGFHHTANLCPETADDPDQDFQDNVCSTFAYVWTRDISGDAMSRDVEMAENPAQPDPFVLGTTYHSGIEVSLSPVDRKNVQGDSYAATSSVELRSPGRQLGTYGIANVGDGEYRISASDGFWDGTSGAKSYTTDEMADPFSAPAPVTIDFFPSTADVYGVITDGDGVEVAGVEVSAGGQTATTDDYGRYILEDLKARVRDMRVTAAKAGYTVAEAGGSPVTAHARANKYSYRYWQKYGHEPRRLDFVLGEETPTGIVSGSIRHLQSGDPIEGVRVFALPAGTAAPAELWKPGHVQDNTAETFAGVAFADVDTTDADGSFSVDAPAGALNGDETTVIAYQSGMFFTPDRFQSPVVDKGEYSVTFQGLGLSAITGRIVATGSNDGMAGVTVTAEGGGTGGAQVMATAVTTANGRYNIRVPWGPYVVTPDKAGTDEYNYTPANLDVTLAAEQIRTLQNFSAAHDGTAPKASLTLTPASISEAGGVSTVTASLNRAHTAAVTVTVAATAATAEAGDFTLSTDTELTIAAGATSSTGTVTITANPDDTEADDETVTVSGTVSTTGTVTAPADETLTIVDDDAAGSKVTLVLSSEEIKEGESATVTATLAAAAPRAFAVTVSANPMTDIEFVGGHKTLHFAAGETSSSASAVGDPVTIQAKDLGNLYEGDRTVTVSGSVTAESLMTAPDAVTLTVKDNESSIPKVTLRVSASSISESATDDGTTPNADESVIAVWAMLDKPHTTNVTVTVVTTPAATGAPFSLGNATLVIPAGEMAISDSAYITPAADNTDADDETIVVSATVADADSPVNPHNDPAAPAAVTVKIVDDDAAPGAPTGLTATHPTLTSGATSTTVTLSWTAPTDLGKVNGVATAAADVVYEYRFKTSGQTNFSAWGGLPGAVSTTGTTVETDLTNVLVNNTYNYEVRAVAHDGSSTTGPAGPGSETFTLAIPPAPSE